jgi:transposase-like protein
MTPEQAHTVLQHYRESRSQIREAAATLYKQGVPVTAIAEWSGVTRYNVYRWLNPPRSKDTR